MSKVYIVAAKRTAIGSYLGSLQTIHPATMGAELIKNIMSELKLDNNTIDEVIVGNVLSAGLGQGVGRQVALKANLPITQIGYSLNMVCGSGMKTAMDGYIKIKAGFGNLIFAGGVENMSKAPFLIPSETRSGYKMGDLVSKDHMVYDALTDVYNQYHMGITAENVAEKYQISREEQDEFALKSQEKAIKAIDSGRFVDEIVPIEVQLKKETIIFAQDEYPNRTTNKEKMAKLRPAFKKDGTVTAGNASGINDGASMLLLASEEAVNKYNLTPLAEIISIGQGGVEPEYMGLGPVPAIENCLQRAGMSLQDMELIELNEAFAAQSLGVLRELSTKYNESIPSIMERTNVNGGAIALGHPVGASGNRIIVTLVHEMKKRQVKYGLASLCIGGGMGTAIIIKSM
ncbi:MAG TPA: acetyl-CoA C-acetyltransferase [Haloplasmataceae bacterium]